MRMSLLLPGCVVLWLPLAGCDQKNSDQPSFPVSSPAPGYVSQPPQPPMSADQLNSLVSPVALFPDNLLALVLVASTTADDVAGAHAWRLENAALKGEALTQAVNGQPWPAAVKSLVAFPDVLSQMAINLPWTRALGNVWTQSPSSVMDAVQALRRRAAQNGALKSTPQQKVETVADDAPATGTGSVSTARSSVTIRPVQPGVVYVPVYSTVVYGDPPVGYYPGYVPPAYSTTDLMMTGLISFTAGVMAGAWSDNSWGWNNWGVHWGRAPVVVYNHRTFVSRTVTDRNSFRWHSRYSGPGPVISPPLFSGRAPLPSVRNPVVNPRAPGRQAFNDSRLAEIRRYREAEPFHTHGHGPLRETYGLVPSRVRGAGPALNSPAQPVTGGELLRRRDMQGRDRALSVHPEDIQSVRDMTEHHYFRMQK